MDITWEIIDKYFKDNTHCLVRHHLETYNDFFDEGIQSIFREKNPIKIMKQQDPDTKEFNLRCNLYLGGKEGNKLYYGKPIVYDNERPHFMYPNEARLRNMTYGLSIHYDVDIDFFIKGDDDDEPVLMEKTLEKIFLGNFPIMLQSKYCVLNTLTPPVRFNMGECKNDRGGYFVINGKEKVIVCQEKFADNMLYIKDSVNDLYSHSAEIRSVSEDSSKPVRTSSIRIVAPSPSSSNNQIVVNVPNVRKPVPLFILMRALGVISDKSIIEYCLLDLDAYETYIDLFIPSVYDAGRIYTQETALKYIATFTKGKTVPHVLDILMNYFLPHIGELNFTQKAFFVGYMVKNLLDVFTKTKKATDRDNFRFKRVETPGILLYDLFKEYYTLQQRDIFQKIDKEYYYHEGVYQKNFPSLIENNFREIFKDRIVETGFKRAFKGNWGSEEHTKREGVVQDLNRLSFNSFISHLRKVNLPLEASAKIIGPHLLHNSQWGIIDPLDTPDGGNVGLHKHMSIVAQITKSCSGYPMTKWMRIFGELQLLEELTIADINMGCKIILNGNWIGIVVEPEKIIKKIRFHRQLALLPVYLSAHWNIQENTIYIYTDGGRLTRPIFYLEDEIPSYERVRSKLEAGEFTWDELITGFNRKQVDNFDPTKCEIYTADQLYGSLSSDTADSNRAIIEYMDSAEEESALISMNTDTLGEKRYTHLEIHPSLILGVMGNQIVFPENNQLPRDLFSCGQSKQAVSLYHSNYQNRIDKMGVVLNYGQMPLVKSRYLEYIHQEEHPYGENAIVAIMCYGGYNVEDAILFNEGSLQRGMFRTTYYNMYETYEESSKIGNTTTDSHFANIESEEVIGQKPGYDYSVLDQYGLINENTKLDDKKVLIGKVTTDLSNPGVGVDSSIFPKKGQLGFVDKTFITEGEEGTRVAKVRIREERVPAIGDKFCSRCGQKGTIGLVIPEKDMPFTDEGVKPDLIVNPHALPSRMTIGQLVECLQGKACAMYGAYGDCTAFVNKGPKNKIFGDLLTNVGYHSSGNQLLYNGTTGEQMNSEIFIGPTYYMRLKHMVKDKINYRAQGPRTMLTRQTVQGRANDGGLRIGEMERDGVIAHGAAKFLEESLMKRGDEYFMAICNKTGTIAIYNNTLNLFLSPNADGPIKFTGTLDNNLNIENISRFGRSFSIVRVPYSFKLLMQELQTMNIQMRIITEDNVDQLQSMAYSKTINKLLFDDNITINDIVQSNKQKLEKENQQESIKFSRKPQTQQASVGMTPQGDIQPPTAPGKYSAVPPPPVVNEGVTIRPAQVPLPVDDPFADSDDEMGKPPISIGDAFMPANPFDIQELPPLQETGPAVSPDFSATSPSYPVTSPQYQVYTPPAQEMGAEQASIGAPQEPVPPSVKATIEVPAGQQGQFTISSSGPPVGDQQQPVSDPLSVTPEDIPEQADIAKGPISVVKADDDATSGGSESVKTIKILK